jgi:triphosphoribosyl-dephospho-CoA synthetase
VIPDRDVWQAAVLLVKRYGNEAMLEAAQRADQVLDEGDMAGAETWHRILDAIERLHAKAPAEGEKVY